jgi:hypothetical protein
MSLLMSAGAPLADYTEAIRLQPNSAEIVQLRSEAYQALGVGAKQETPTPAQANNKPATKKQVATKPGKKPTPIAGTTPSATPSASVSSVQRWFVDHLRRQAHADLFPSPSPSAAKPKQANN